MQPAPDRDGEGIEEQGGGSQRSVGLGVVEPLEQGPDDRKRQRGQQPCGGDRQDEHPAQRLVDGAVHCDDLALGEQPGQKGVGGDARRLGDDPDRDQHGAPGVEQVGLRPVAHQIAEDRHEPLVERHYRLPDHQRDGQGDVLPDRRMAPRGGQFELHADPPGPPPLDGEAADEGAGEGTPDEALRVGGPGDPGIGNAAHDDQQVVDDRSQDGDAEHPLGELDRSEHGADHKGELCRERNAREPHRGFNLFRGEVRVQQVDQPGRDRPSDGDQRGDADR